MIYALRDSLTSFGRHAAIQDFGPTPPAAPRPDKTLCAAAGVRQREVAAGLLRLGIMCGLAGRQMRNGFPQNVWAVNADGRPFGAQLENASGGVYHSYPMASSDPVGDEILRLWTRAR